MRKRESSTNNMMLLSNSSKAKKDASGFPETSFFILTSTWDFQLAHGLSPDISAKFSSKMTSYF
ncbi:hypothetical protein [Paenibacillus kribbensis]|uniref:hypothetical protein n=1 Tax=Paenibacillus kribbensis TaxID=172713 RepID=UPI0008386BEF|nr:hypothetical protein [Paenibacillus kribbensis]